MIFDICVIFYFFVPQNWLQYCKNLDFVTVILDLDQSSAMCTGKWHLCHLGTEMLAVCTSAKSLGHYDIEYNADE